MPETYIIGDIHGCSQTLKALLEFIAPNKQDTIVFLGDYIDRGPDSAGVIDSILKLISGGYKVIPLRGNHEENILKAYHEYDAPTFTHFVKRISKSRNLLDRAGNLHPKYLQFFTSLPCYYAAGDILCVHAGLNPSHENPLKDTLNLLEQRQPPVKNQLEKMGFKYLAHGHVPANISEIEQAVKTHSHDLPLDNGCIYTQPHKIYDYTQLGHLCCLAVDKWELVRVGNVDL